MQRNDILKLFSGHAPFEKYKLPQRAEVFHYLWLCYAKKSPLVRDISDISKRQIAASQESSYTPTPEVINLEDERFAELLDYFLCEIENDLTFQMLISCEALFKECQQNMRRPLITEEIVTREGKEGEPDKEVKKSLLDQDELLKALSSKGALAQLSETTANRIEKYRAQIYKEVDEKKVAKKKFRPESVRTN